MGHIQQFIRWPSDVRMASMFRVPRVQRLRFFRADVVAQPFVPHAAGEPGLLFRLPTVTETPEVEKYTFHVVSNTFEGGGLHYRGKYTRVPVPQIHCWSNLPREVRDPETLLLIRHRSVTYYSFGSSGPYASVLHTIPPSAPSVHVSNFGINAGGSPPLWRSRPIFSIFSI